MPLLRYFIFVGGSLLALLFVVNAAFPTEPLPETLTSGSDLPVVRIPGRPHHVRVPPRRDPPKRERAIRPNWKPQHTVGNVRLNAFHPMGGGMGGGHRGR